jgi:tRNA(adenine34) deaminase
MVLYHLFLKKYRSKEFQMADHETYMKEALREAAKALDAGEFPVGCVMVSENEIIARGHRLNSRESETNELDHSEIVTLRQVIEQHPEKDISSITVYSTMEPCLMCYATLLLNGVRKFVYGYEDLMGGGTGLDLYPLNPLYREMKVEVIPHVLRHESMELFKTFFSNPDNTYWQDSPLAQYTLTQCSAKKQK